MSSKLSSYLASKYLTADPAPSSKKRKHKHHRATSKTLIIRDDDADFSSSSKPRGYDEDNEDNDSIPTLDSSARSAEFRKTKKSSWKVIGSVAPTESDLKNKKTGGDNVDDDDEAAEADAIIASTALENAAASHQDEGPTIVKMGDGTHAGLQTAEAVAAQLATRRAEELAEFEAQYGSSSGGKKRRKGQPEEEQETVYRDATGRRIDISLRRADARREAEKAAAEEKRKKDEALGAVQLRERERRKEELEEAKFMPLARGVDDEEMNRELKERRRWNDPAAMFLTQKDDEVGDGERSRADGGGEERKMGYKGAAPPNRYGIRPGYRWDGVDRSNGWEAERFKYENARERRKGLEFSWQMDE